ncbi:unnamed protein product [Alternaria sp. RS040]
MPGVQHTQMERELPTGVDVLVVGGGIGGLTCAIEAYRKGHNVRILERNQEGQYSGLLDYHRTSNCANTTAFIQHHAPGHSKNSSLDIYRKKLHNLLNTYVKELGIPITHECRVGAYFETNQTGGVILDNGERIIADVVVAADGVSTKSREIIDGNKDKPIKSGFVVYRSSFPAGPAIKKSPLLAKAFTDYENRVFMYIDPGAHVVFGLNQDEFWYLLTTKVGRKRYGNRELVEKYFQVSSMPGSGSLLYGRRNGPAKSDIARVRALDAGSEEGADGRTRSISANDQVSFHVARTSFACLVLYKHFVSLVLQFNHLVSMEMCNLAITVLVARRGAILALDSINVSPEHIVCKVPAGHVLLHVFLVYASDVGHTGQVLTSDDARALIVEEGGRIPFEEGDGVCMWCWKSF